MHRSAALLLLALLALACRSPIPPAPGSAGAAGVAIPIAVVPFGSAPGSPPPPVDVARVIRIDLVATGRFAALDAAELPARPTGLAAIEFEQWRGRADYLVVGVVAVVHDGGYEVEFRVVDTRSETSVVGYLVPASPGELEATARRIAGIVDERLTGRVAARAE